MKVVCGNTRVENVCTLELLAGESKICAHSSWHPRQEERCSNIWEEANRCLRHCKHCPFRSYPKWCVNTQPNSTTHSNSIHECYNRFRIGRNQMVELVLLAKIVCRSFDT